MAIPFVQKGVEWFTNRLSVIGTVKKPNRPVGTMNYTERFLDAEPSTKFFVNETFGAAMNQDVSFGATGNILHDGGSSASVDTGNANTNSEFFLEDSGGSWGTGGDAELVQVGMTVEETGASNYARISTVTATKLGLTTIASKGGTSSDIFPAGTEAYIINAVWTGTATQGTWDFATSNVITQAAGNNGDQADIEGVAGDQSLASDFTALTGSINLNTYSEANNNITLQMTLAGVGIGNSINLNDFIDTGDFAAQQFSIPIADLGLSDNLTNGIRIIVVRTGGGGKPAFTFDDVRLEVTGTPLVYEINLGSRERFHIHEIVFSYRDNIDSITTVTGATETVTNQALDVSKILGLSALTNGFVIKRTKDTKALFSATIRTLGGHISAGAKPDPVLTAPDGSSTFVVLRAIFKNPLILSPITIDRLTITNNDNMSDLQQFTASARGDLEIVP